MILFKNNQQTNKKQKQIMAKKSRLGAPPTAYGGSQARGPMGAVAAGLRQSHSNVGSSTYTTAHGNAGSLTH